MAEKLIDTEAEVLENRFISGNLWLMRLKPLCKMPAPKAGQFLMLEVSPTYDPMGRRAFAVADFDEESLWIYYDVVGRGTELMSFMKPGDITRIFTHLGKGLFSYDARRHLLVGGGVGLAGLTLFGKELKSMGKDVVFVYGARSKEHLGMVEWLEKEGFEYILYTDDGSEGKKGFVTEAIKEFGSEWCISACGPYPMLKSLVKLSEETGHEVYLSLESRMACGWGVCLGCVVKGTNGKFMRVCYEGPVFKSDSVRL